MKRDLTPEQLAQPVTLTLPLSAVLHLAELGVQARTPEFSPRAVPGDFLPKVGEPFKDGLFAGLTLHQGEAHALVLLPGDEKLNWKDAMAWAEKQGGVLPSRFDLLVLWTNLKKEFEEDAWYWSGDVYEKDADYAWGQYFGNGIQYSDHKDDRYRCRAVRRVTL